MLRATVSLFSTAESGRTVAISGGFRCIGVVDSALQPPITGWDVMPLLESPLAPGESRDLDLLFLTDEGKKTMQEAGTFHLWDGRFFGKAVVQNGPYE